MLHKSQSVHEFMSLSVIKFENFYMNEPIDDVQAALESAQAFERDNVVTSLYHNELIQMEEELNSRKSDVYTQASDGSNLWT